MPNIKWRVATLCCQLAIVCCVSNLYSAERMECSEFNFKTIQQRRSVSCLAENKLCGSYWFAVCCVICGADNQITTRYWITRYCR